MDIIKCQWTNLSEIFQNHTGLHLSAPTDKMVLFDVLLEDIGALGLAQIILILLYSFYNISGGMNALATVFIAYTPDYR